MNYLLAFTEVLGLLALRAKSQRVKSFLLKKEWKGKALFAMLSSDILGLSREFGEARHLSQEGWISEAIP